MFAGVPVALAIALAFAAYASGWGWLQAPAGLLLALGVFVVSFFRDPRRVPPPGDALLVSPADGHVADIATVREDAYLKEDAVRIGIFLSVFDVHVNRAPASGTVEYLRYTPGKFVAAMRGEAGTVNEANAVGIAAGGGVKLLVRQVAGLIARRIVCPLAVGTPLERGEDFGMIRFGSRTELLIPAALQPEIRVKVGDRVKGGTTVLAAVGALDRAGQAHAAAREARE